MYQIKIMKYRLHFGAVGNIAQGAVDQAEQVNNGAIKVKELSIVLSVCLILQNLLAEEIAATENDKVKQY